MTGNVTFTGPASAVLRNKLESMIRSSVQERMLIDIGFTLPETRSLARRMESIAAQATTVHPADPRLARLHHLLGEHPGIEAVLVNSVGILLGTGGWLVTPDDRMAASDTSAFNRFLDNLVHLGERLAARDKQVPDA